ncbi:hypothetical protein QE152_g29415 [Popillia japonica]|uniref:Uncharacterized protein n=1 Tax=Popillia japonica TaxID=7064 RepID=A0AAW1JI29_POPJA
MHFKALFGLCILWAFTTLLVAAGGGGDGGHETVKIIIPVHEKTIKHTHTIYKTIHHQSKDDLGLDEALSGHGWGWGR